MQEFKDKWCDILYQASIFQSLPKWLLQTHLATKPEELWHMKFLQALWEKLLDWGWQTKLAPLLGNSCSVNSLLIIQQRILSRGWVKGEAKDSLVSPSCGKAAVKNTLTLSTILLCSGTLKNKQTGFVFFPWPPSLRAAGLYSTFIDSDNVEVLHFHLSPVTGGKGALCSSMLHQMGWYNRKDIFQFYPLVKKKHWCKQFLTNQCFDMFVFGFFSEYLWADACYISYFNPY